MKQNKFRSNFERSISVNLQKRGIDFEYEQDFFEYFLNVRKGRCVKCGNTKVVESHTYNPDWKIGSMYIESKGRFTAKDRIKMIAVKMNHPDLDIRMLFMADNWLTSNKRDTYSGWCKKHGFPYAFLKVPPEWVEGR